MHVCKKFGSPTETDNVFNAAPVEGEHYIQFVNISNADGSLTGIDDECSSAVYVNSPNGGVPFGAATHTSFYVS